jgi:protein SCO1/2
MRREPAPPPVLAQLPPFELVDSRGDRFGSEDLVGRLWVLGFFSTTDGAAMCGGLSDSMADLDRRFAEAGVDGVSLLGVSSDPEGDSPARLREFASSRALEPGRFRLTTGEIGQIRRLAGELARATGQPREGEAGRLRHACELFLIDGSGGVRGSYRDDTKGLDELFHRSQHVLRAAR